MTNMILLDTNILSELRKVQKGQGDKNVATWAKTLDLSKVYLSSVVVGEIYQGILLKKHNQDVEQAMLLKKWFDEWVLIEFKNRILHIDDKTAMVWAELQIPNPRSVNDSYIASTAIAHNLMIATRNVKDFANMPVQLINPFEFKQS